jgi:subtilisin family serine protease
VAFLERNQLTRVGAALHHDEPNLDVQGSSTASPTAANTTVHELVGTGGLRPASSGSGGPPNVGGFPRNLDRLDQRDLPYDGRYQPMSGGAGTVVYVVDSGVRASHTEFRNLDVGSAAATSRVRTAVNLVRCVCVYACVWWQRTHPPARCSTPTLTSRGGLQPFYELDGVHPAWRRLLRARHRGGLAGGRYLAALPDVLTGAGCDGVLLRPAGLGWPGNMRGVAPRATLVDVRVLDCEGLGTVSDVIAGLEYVSREHAKTVRCPAVPQPVRDLAGSGCIDGYWAVTVEPEHGGGGDVEPRPGRGCIVASAGAGVWRCGCDQPRHCIVRLPVVGLTACGCMQTVRALIERHHVSVVTAAGNWHRLGIPMEGE